MMRPRMYAAVAGVIYGVGKSFVDLFLFAGKVDWRSPEMVLALTGEMTRAAIPWLLVSASKRWQNRSLQCTRPWSYATIGPGTSTGREPYRRQIFSAKTQ